MTETTDDKPMSLVKPNFMPLKNNPEELLVLRYLTTLSRQIFSSLLYLVKTTKAAREAGDQHAESRDM